MEAFLTAILVIFIITVGLIAIGLYLISKLVGGFSNLKSIYRLFSGGERGTTKQRTTRASSSSERSSRTYNNKEEHKKQSQTSGKMFDDNEGTYVDFEEVKES